MVEEVPFWWHTINFGDAVVSPGHNNLYDQGVISKALPFDLTGKSVLDVGCWDGAHSFEAEEKDAAEVLAIDSGQQQEFVRSRYDQEIDPTQGIRTAQKLLDSAVQFEPIDFSEMEGSGQEFDVTFYLGVLYHQRYPLRSLRTLREVTGETAIIESATLRWPSQKPQYKFYPNDEFNHDPTNWFVPNVPGLLDWVHRAGFQKAELLKRYGLGSRAIVQAWK